VAFAAALDFDEYFPKTYTAINDRVPLAAKPLVIARRIQLAALKRRL
jgi:hypothetical protein